MSTNVVVSLRNLSKSFETSEVVTWALVDVDLDIGAGEFISISGPSGCGKSTLLAIIGLLDEPTAGTFLLDGVDVSKASLNRAAELRCEKIGFVFQSFNLIENLTVSQNVGLPLQYSNKRLTRVEKAERIAECLELVGLSNRANHKPAQLSGGQQQRVAIARALVGKPSILLIDEPTGNLDSKMGDAIMQFFNELNSAGTTICMVTHDPVYAGYAKRQLVLKDGRLGEQHERELAAV